MVIRGLQNMILCEQMCLASLTSNDNENSRILSARLWFDFDRLWSNKLLK